MTRDPIWDALKEHSTEKFNSDRQRFIQEAEAKDDGLWTKHSKYHWSRYVRGHNLQFWPSRRKFSYRGKVKRGDVWKFIEGMEAEQ